MPRTCQGASRPNGTRGQPGLRAVVVRLGSLFARDRNYVLLDSDPCVTPPGGSKCMTGIGVVGQHRSTIWVRKTVRHLTANCQHEFVLAQASRTLRNLVGASPCAERTGR